MNWLNHNSRIVFAVLAASISLMFDVSCLLGQEDGDRSEIAKVPVWLTAEKFEALIMDGATPRGGLRGRLEKRLTEKIRELAIALPLSESIQRKIKLAGRGDILRFFEKLDDQVLAARKLALDGVSGGDLIRPIHQSLKPLKIQNQIGLFVESSLFHKTLWANLDDEQRRHLAAYLTRERQEDFESQFDKVLAEWPIFPMLKEQRETLKQFLAREIPPPLHIKSHCSDYILFQLAKLPEEKVRPLFELIQWDDFSDLMERAKSYEDELVEHGLLLAKSTAENEEDTQ